MDPVGLYVMLYILIASAIVDMVLTFIWKDNRRALLDSAAVELLFAALDLMAIGVEGANTVEVYVMIMGLFLLVVGLMRS